MTCAIRNSATATLVITDLVVVESTNKVIARIDLTDNFKTEIRQVIDMLKPEYSRVGVHLYSSFDTSDAYHNAGDCRHNIFFESATSRATLKIVQTIDSINHHPSNK